MREAGFMDSMVYHLLPVGINFSIDKLKCNVNYTL